MDQHGLPPAHPSLPRNPHLPSYAPYPQLQTFDYSGPSYHSSHYAQAYLQQAQAHAQAAYWNAGPSTLSFAPPPPPNFQPPVQHGSWYQPGTCRCSQPGCAFVGSHKSVEIHMMDRHLIYPPGWEKRKRADDWDADPSLKGKPILIQGTNLTLDTPEALDAWLEERRRRWPSAARVVDKKRKLDDARASGQIGLDDPALLGGGKRRRTEADGGGRGRGRGGRGAWSQSGGADRGRGRGSGRGRGVDSGWRGRGRGGANVLPHSSDAPERALAPTGSDSSSSDSEASSDDPPEVVSSKPPPEVAGLPAEADQPPEAPDDSAQRAPSPKPPHPSPRKVPPQPRKSPRNPFAERPSLLRNLLLPEIRMTVSNFSQAIRFLVDNDFLDGVELKPGDAERKMIEVIGGSEAVDGALEDHKSRADEGPSEVESAVQK